ncbi:MAG: uroporphyrinogen decarboxylase family protein [Eubacteriales bacterium]|nr:uroporphyrinogen decarboxylase family protein [Eubacteriales bacterium]
MEELKTLLEKYVNIVYSKQNQENKKYWENADEPFLAERWRGRSLRKENTPFTMAMDISGYSKVLDIDCLAYYAKPEIQLKEQLRYAIWEYENLKCHRAFDNTAFVSFGTALEASFFGAKIHFLPGQAPWFDEREPIFKDKADLLKLKPFDFYNSGLCGRAHYFYETMKKLTEGYDINVMFPITLRSPFSIAIMLRGFENLLVDIYEDPEFFDDILTTIAGYLKEYAKARAKFLNEPMPKFMLCNDEISTPTLSDRLYREKVLPIERDLAVFAGGVRYWHSCGVTTDFYESIASIPGLQMMHIGPWSDVKKAAEVFSKKDIAIEICLNSVADIYEGNEDEMRAKLLSIKEACDGKVRYQVRADGFAVLNSVEFTMEKIRQWNKVALEVFPG